MTPNPKIAVIIVNYNVAFFLEQCLNSVAKAMELEPAEVWVVDNQSVDGSVAMVREKFPWVRLIANQDNKGFSKANNQAMELSNCDYQLLLNPDTVIEEDTLQKVVAYMDNHPETGGLGVRMVDGKGRFLPESKRGLPTPAVAFYKIFGLSRLFPNSKLFGKYHLGYLSEFETNEIEILSGAFMLMRKKALDKVGLLDEDFFMYGEDIDLSYRILLGGYKNVYFPETRIIHYKGESTKKSSVNYVFVFYRAMVIFAKKHFSQKNAKLFSFFINAAIYFRASLAIISRFIKKTALPLIDVVYLFFGMMALTNYWKSAAIFFPEHISKLLIGGYTSIWFLAHLFQGTYDEPIKIKRFFNGTLIGLGIILIGYGILPKEWQFSRLFIFLSAIWVTAYYFISRILLHFAIGKRFRINGTKHTNFTIVGSVEEFERVSKLIHLMQPNTEKCIHVSLDTPEGEINLNQIAEVIRVHNIHEVIFCAKDITASDIIGAMIQIDQPTIDFKIAQPDSQFLIGSNSIETAGDLYILNINSLSEPTKQRQKRVFDVLLALLVLITFPINCWWYNHKLQLLKNGWNTLVGKCTWVGYSKGLKNNQLPRLKKNILIPNRGYSEESELFQSKMDLLYAREYRFFLDIQIVMHQFKKLDQRP